MWIESENSDSTKPLEIDNTSSRAYVYVRKDFEEVPTYDQEGTQIGTHWKYKENKVNREDWETYTDIINTQNDITDIQLALVELYERG